MAAQPAFEPLVKRAQRSFARLSATQDVRSAARALARECAACEPAFVVRIALALIDAGLRQPAYELVNALPEQRAKFTARQVLALSRGLASWGDVDAFAWFVAGPCWRARCITDAIPLRWTRSRDRWLRRAALASTVPLNARSRGGTGDTPRTLLVCERLVDDRDDMVVKALSWALRELSKRDPEAAREFVEAHRDRLAARVVREVEHKLRSGRKSGRSG